MAYRSTAVIRGCVISLLRDPSIKQVVVVNNSPDDATGTALEGIDRVAYLEASTNVGFGCGVNLARSVVTSPYVVLANPDTIQTFGTATSLLRFMTSHDRCAMVAPRMVTATGSIDRNSQHDVRLARMAFQALGWPESLQVMRSEADHLREHQTQSLIGAFVLCRVKALDQVGWFDETIFLFGEDQDLCRRLRRADWEIWFTPVGHVQHLDGHSWRQLPDKGASLFREARSREVQKAGGRIEAAVYRALARIRDKGMRRNGGADIRQSTSDE